MGNGLRKVYFLLCLCLWCVLSICVLLLCISALISSINSNGFFFAIESFLSLIAVFSTMIFVPIVFVIFVVLLIYHMHHKGQSKNKKFLPLFVYFLLTIVVWLLFVELLIFLTGGV